MYMNRPALVSMIEALVNFYSPGIPFVLISACDCIIHSKWFVLCGIYAFRWENENGHELYWKLHKCTLCISAHAHLHIDAAVQIDIWPHRTIKNYHTSSILFRNCIIFGFTKTYGHNESGCGWMCTLTKEWMKGRKRKNKCSNDITAIIIEYNLFGVLFSFFYCALCPLSTTSMLLLCSDSAFPRFDNPIEIERSENDARLTYTYYTISNWCKCRQIDSNPFWNRIRFASIQLVQPKVY